MRRLLILAFMLLPLTPVRAEAVTVQEIIQLTRAGLSDDVLLALIEVDRRVFSIDADTLSRLKQAGVSERVILAMIRSGRTPPPEESPVQEPPVAIEQPEPSPPVVVIEHQETVREVPVPVPVPAYPVSPVYVQPGAVYPIYGYPWQGRVHGQDDNDLRMRLPGDRRMRLPSDGVAEPSSERDHREPVYWGNGGQRRPDAWKPKEK